MTRTIQFLLLLLSAAWVAYGTPTFNIDNNDICLTTNCTSGGTSYVGSNAGTGESDYSGVAFKGTPNPNDSFDSAGFICTTPGASCPTAPNGQTYASGLTITRDTTEFQNLNMYRFLDTFTNNTSSTITGVVNIFTNLAWLTASEGPQGAAYPYSTDKSQLVVMTDTGNCGGCTEDNRPAYTLVTGNNAWSNANVDYYLDGRSPTDNFDITVAPGQSVSILEFMGLSATEPTTGNYVPNAAAAYTMGEDLLSDPYTVGLTQTQLASVVNFTFTPEPGTFGLLGAGFGVAFLKLRQSERRKFNKS